MSKSKKYLSFEARMSYRKNGAIQVTSPDPDLGGLFLTLKKGTESYAIALEALRSQGMVPEGQESKRLSYREVQSLRHTDRDHVLLGVDQTGQPVHWSAYESPLQVHGHAPQAVGLKISQRSPSSLYTTIKQNRKTDLAASLDEYKNSALEALGRGRNTGGTCLFLDYRFLSEVEASKLAEIAARMQQLRLTYVLYDTGIGDSSASIALASQLSNLYVYGSSIVSKEDWLDLPQNSAYWLPRGAKEAKLIELV